MPALFHTPGPVLVYAKGLADSTFSFLGTATVTPEFEAKPAYLPVMNDLAGRSVPMQRIYDGEEHLIYCTLNRFNYTLWKALRDAQTHTLDITNHGVDTRLERGSLTVSAGDFQLLFKNDFYGTAAGTADLPIGRVYYSAIVAAYKESGATRVQEIATVFQTSNVYDAANRRFSLYTEVTAAFGSIPNPD